MLKRAFTHLLQRKGDSVWNCVRGDVSMMQCVHHEKRVVDAETSNEEVDEYDNALVLHANVTEQVIGCWEQIRMRNNWRSAHPLSQL